MQHEAFAPPPRPTEDFSMARGGAILTHVFDDAIPCSPAAIASENQHRQMMMQMEQRRLDQQRESEIRRESQARDQQFNMQQMASCARWRTKDNDGFFDTDMKTIFKQRMEQMLDGGGNSGALERASRLLQPEMLGFWRAQRQRHPYAESGSASGPPYDPYPPFKRPWRSHRRHRSAGATFADNFRRPGAGAAKRWPKLRSHPSTSTP